MNPLVSITGLEKTFCKGNVCVANRINLEVYEGEIFTLLGKSGSGKTTFLRMLAGLESPDKGHICIDGVSVFDAKTQMPPHQRGISLVFQNYALLPHLSIAQNITFGATYDAKRLEEIARITKLDTVLTKFPHEISGGQQQRVALSRAIISRPKILLMDEPLSNIDTQLRMLLRTELKEMIRSFGITTLLITHDKEDAFFLSDRIAIMEGGDILQVGTPKEVYTHPSNLYCANFLGKINTLPEALLSLLGIAQKAYCRYDALTLTPHGMFDVRIESIIFYGTYYEIGLLYETHMLYMYSFDDTLCVGQTHRCEIAKEKLLFLA